MLYAISCKPSNGFLLMPCTPVNTEILYVPKSIEIENNHAIKFIEIMCLKTYLELGRAPVKLVNSTAVSVTRPVRSLLLVYWSPQMFATIS